MTYAFLGIVLIYLLSLLSIGLLALPIVPYLTLTVFYPKSGADFNRTLLAVLSLLILAGCFINPLNTGLFVLFSFAPALAIIYAEKRGMSGSCYTVAAAGIAALAVFYMALLPHEARTALERDIALSIEQLYKSFNFTEAARLTDDSYITRIYREKERYAALFAALTPAFAFAVSAVSTYFTEKLYFSPPPNRILKVPDIWLALLGAGLFAVAAPEGVIPERAVHIGYQIFVAGVSLYFFRGTDIALYYLTRWKFGRFFKAFFCSLILLESMLTLAVALLGFVSVYKNLLPAEDKGGRLDA